jgi:peptide-methionine (S)-S-oxide reductase
VTTKTSSPLAAIGFGGGCHWCTEAVFASLRGVTRVEQGYIRSAAPHHEFSEAVLIDFDKQVIPLATLIEIHLRTHASTSLHSMRNKYRSAVYVGSAPLADRCKSILNALQPEFRKPLITQVLELIEFQPSPEQYKGYYAADPTRPFCTTYIDPKLAMLRKQYASFVRT